MEIAQVVGVHGVRGGLRVTFLSGEVVGLRPGQRVQLVADPGQAERSNLQLSATVQRIADKPGTAMARLWVEELSDRNAAEVWRGAKVLVQRDDLEDLDEDEFYLADLIGATVVHRGATDLSLGVIDGVVDTGAQDLFEIAWGSGTRTRTWLLPVVPAYIEDIDLEGQRLVVDLPEGLLPAELERGLKSREPSDEVDEPAQVGVAD